MAPPPATADAAALAVVPARFASSRLPGKPLLDRTGRPMIQHVVERVAQCPEVGRVLVATDDQRIFDVVTGFGGEAVMTRADHPNGTSRIAEVVSQLGESCPGVVVNVQGDEPEIEPALLTALIAALRDGNAPMATIAAPMTQRDEPGDPNVVKVVRRLDGAALYFSRRAIPFVRSATGQETPGDVLKHVGVYAYRSAFLPVYAGLAPTPLEQAERLEQLRALEHGYAIAVGLHPAAHHGIDTPEQYEAFVGRWLSQHGG